MDYLEEVREFHRTNVEPYTGRPRGCWQFQVNALERVFGFELPEAYKQFLKWMGRDYRGVFVGTDWFVDNVIENTGLVSSLLSENSVSFELPQNFLSFFSHQGYMAAWFALPEANDNPLVWFYSENVHEAPVLEGSFTEFLMKDMQRLAVFLPTTYGGSDE